MFTDFMYETWIITVLAMVFAVVDFALPYRRQFTLFHMYVKIFFMYNPIPSTGPSN